MIWSAYHILETVLVSNMLTIHPFAERLTKNKRHLHPLEFYMFYFLPKPFTLQDCLIILSQ